MAFGVLVGEILLQHDMEVAMRKLDAQLRKAKESGELGSSKHRLGEPEYHWPAADVPVVDLEDVCMQPAVHDGTGDCGCPAIGED